MDDKVQRWPLGPDLTISRVLTGLWQIADMERSGPLDPARTAEAMLAYVQAGFTTFDMADHYGSAELVAGEFVARYGHESAQMFTKWVPKPGPSTEQEVRDAVQRSLDRMRTDRLDLLQFHAWNYADPSYLDTLEMLQTLREQGLIRYLGLTNVDTPHLRLLLHSGFEIASNQVCFSLLDQRARANGMLQLCQQHGVTVLAFGTLAGGFLSERWLGVDEPDWDRLETWSQMKYGRFIREAGGWERFQVLLAAVHRVAQRHEVSIANVACRAILDQPAVGGVIVGARLGERDHIEDNARVFDLVLDDLDRRQIDEALADLRPIPGDCGDEYRRAPFLTATGDLSQHIDRLPAPFKTKSDDRGRTRAFSGTVWEETAAYCRALCIGERVLVSGTTATHRDRAVGGDDPEAQTDFVIDKIEGALQSLGGSLQDVVRTRVLIARLQDWEPVARAHGRRFRGIEPANTLVQAGLIGAPYRVEIEAEAVLRRADPDSQG